MKQNKTRKITEKIKETIETTILDIARGMGIEIAALLTRIIPYTLIMLLEKSIEEQGTLTQDLKNIFTIIYIIISLWSLGLVVREEKQTAIREHKKKKKEEKECKNKKK